MDGSHHAELVVDRAVVAVDAGSCERGLKRGAIARGSITDHARALGWADLELRVERTERGCFARPGETDWRERICRFIPERHRVRGQRVRRAKSDLIASMHRDVRAG